MAPKPAPIAPSAASAIRTITTLAAASTKDGRPRIAPEWQPQPDGSIALMFPPSFAAALVAGEMIASSTGKSASPVVLLKPPAALVVDREDGETVQFDLTCAVFAKAGVASAVRIS